MIEDMGEVGRFGGDDGDEPRIVTVVPTGPARGVVVRRPRGGGLPVRDQGAPGARPWAATGMMDVEHLVTWAYRDQRVDRVASAGLYAIEAEVAGHLMYGRSSDGCAQLADIAHMGCRVDKGGVVISDCVHPAADAVAVALGDIEQGRMIAAYGRVGGRPDQWRQPPPGRWFRAVQWREPWVEAEPERYRGRPVLCEIMPTRTTADIARGMEEYDSWWEGLERLAWQLSMRNLGFAVTGPAAPRAPWKVGA